MRHWIRHGLHFEEWSSGRVPAIRRHSFYAKYAARFLFGFHFIWKCSRAHGGGDLWSLHQACGLAAAVEIRGTDLDPRLWTNPHVRFNDPLVPDLGIICLTPHRDLKLAILWEVKWLLRSTRKLASCLGQWGLDGENRFEKLAFKGKNIGNQETISLLLRSMCSGNMLSSTGSLLSVCGSNRTDSK